MSICLPLVSGNLSQSNRLLVTLLEWQLKKAVPALRDFVKSGRIEVPLQLKELKEQQ